MPVGTSRAGHVHACVPAGTCRSAGVVLGLHLPPALPHPAAATRCTATRLPLPPAACRSHPRQPRCARCAVLSRWREFCMGMAFIFLLLAFQHLSRRYK